MTSSSVVTDCLGTNIDLVLVIDGSWYNRNFANSASSVADTLDRFRSCAGELSIAIIVFAGDARVDLNLYDNAGVAGARSVLLSLQPMSGYEHNLNAALLQAEQSFAQGRSGARKLIFVVSAYAASGFEGTASRLQQNGYLIAGYGFDGGSSNSAWLGSLVSNPALRFDSFEFNLNSYAPDFVNNLKSLLDSRPSGKWGGDWSEWRRLSTLPLFVLALSRFCALHKTCLFHSHSLHSACVSSCNACAWCLSLL